MDNFEVYKWGGLITPIFTKKFGELSLDSVDKMLEIEKDNFGRLVAFVFQDELFVDKTLVEEGLAQASSGDHPLYGSKLLSAQDSSQLSQRNIWSSLCIPQDPNCRIKGNVRRDKGTKIYHLSKCYNYKKIVINEKENDQWFCTEQEAQSAGFTESEDCPK